jgi:triosephosphate isomerase
MRALIGTSWKMNLTSSEAEKYFRLLVPLVDDLPDRDLFVLPPFTSLWVARRVLETTRISWGGQDVHHDSAGAHTGDVSAAMLADLGCTYAEVGHSERRHEHGERDARSAGKVASAITSGLHVILCVGESHPMGLSSARGVVRRHLAAIVGDLNPQELSRVVVAYEPHWAIGVGATAAEPDYVSAVHLAIHDWLANRGCPDARVIYGGSVNSDNCEVFLGQPGVNGLFVGRAALDPVVFSQIAHARIASQVEPRVVHRAGDDAVTSGE